VAHNLASLELAAGRPERALALLEPFRASEDSRIGVVLASAHEALGDPTSARPIWSRLASDPTSPDIAARALAALARLDRVRDPRHALAELEQARRRTKDVALTAHIDALEAAIQIEVAEAELRQGRTDDARALFARAEHASEPALSARARLGGAIVTAQTRGFAPALALVDAIPDAGLGAALDPFLERGARAFASQYLAYLAMDASQYREQRSLARPSEQVVARRRGDVPLALHAAWLERMLGDAIASGRPEIAQLVVGDARGIATSREFRHNAAVSRPTLLLPTAEAEQLRALEGQLPEARINLALSAHARGDDRKALELLRQVDAKTIATYDLGAWLAWMEHLE
jgi:hypothetical protein